MHTQKVFAPRPFVRVLMQKVSILLQMVWHLMLKVVVILRQAETILTQKVIAQLPLVVILTQKAMVLLLRGLHLMLRVNIP